jgi:hypothetical protein
VAAGEEGVEDGHQEQGGGKVGSTQAPGVVDALAALACPRVLACWGTRVTASILRSTHLSYGNIIEASKLLGKSNCI